jgi:hypothetical protein
VTDESVRREPTEPHRTNERAAMTPQSEEYAAVRRYVIVWRWWPVEDRDCETLEGPYDTREAANAAATERYPLIDKWHDAGWELRTVYPAGVFPPTMRASHTPSKDAS